MAGDKEDFKFPDEQETTQQAAADDGVEIEIIDDTPERDRGRKPLDKEVADPTDEEIESYSEKVQSRIKELTHARHDERRRKESLEREKMELERLAQHLINENNKLKQSYNEGQEVLVHSARKEAETKLEMARRKLKEAQEAFDTDAIIAAQEDLAGAKWELENAKMYRPQALQETQLPVQTESQQVPVQPDERSLRWQAKNQWFGQPGFEEYTSYALGLHQKLVTGGVDPRSNEYFDQIDGRMKSKFPELFGGNEDKPTAGETPARKPAAVVAPATRSSGAKKIQLTARQVELAKKFNIDPRRYAAEVLKLENQNG